MRFKSILGVALIPMVAYAANPVVGEAATAAVVAPSVDDFTALDAEFDAALVEYTKELKAADKAARRELRANSPIKRYWPRFEAMSKAGEGRATLWLAEHIKENRDVRSKDRGAVLTPLYQSIIDNHADAEWFTGAVKSLAANKKYVGAEASIAMLEKAAKTAKSDNAKAASLFFAASIVGDSDPERAQKWMDEISEKYSNTVYGTAARASKATPEDSEVGKVAPTFVGETIDGFQFSLEDYRGKVVALDFYGFW